MPVSILSAYEATLCVALIEPDVMDTPPAGAFAVAVGATSLLQGGFKKRRADLPVFDPDAVKRMAEYLAPSVIDTYLKSLVSRCQTVSAALCTSGALVPDNEILADAAHTLAGSAGMLGFVRLADDGVRLEQALRHRSPELPSLAARLAGSIEATLGEVHNILSLSRPCSNE